MDSERPHGLPYAEEKRTKKKKISKKNGKARLKKSNSGNNNKIDTIASSYGLSYTTFIFAILIVFLYLYGFVQSVRSLPEVDSLLEPGHHFAGLSAKGEAEQVSKIFAKEPIKDNDPAEHKNNKLRRHQINSGDGNKNSNNSAIKLPEAKWPVSIRDETNFEDILHPGDKTTILAVPKFWSPPLVGEDGTEGSLISRDLATRFGSYTNGRIDTDYDERGPEDERTIFVAIASYRDWQCRYTVESLLNTARFPNRVRVAVVDQLKDGDASCGVPMKSCEEDSSQALCKYIDQVDVFEVESTLACGPVFARHIGHRMYRGEYYAMQIDAHVTMVKDWDVDIIKQIESTHNEMAVLSTYLTDIAGSIDARTGKSKRNTRPIMCNTDYEGGQEAHLRHGSQPETRVSITGSPQMQPYWAAGWSFSRGHFVVNVPYDLHLPMIFMGEEISIGVRAFTKGYDHYASERSICFHTYANGENAAARNKVKHFWENAALYRGSGVGAMKRLNGIIGMNPEVDPSVWDHTDEKLYGIGHERQLSKFFDTFGIHVVEKKVEHHLCSFVQTGRMHKQFLHHLRPNAMGIDYSKVVYKFTDPDK